MALDLDYQARNALTLIGQAAAEQKRFEMFEALASEMGTREWQRIIRMADAAVRACKRDLAPCEVAERKAGLLPPQDGV